jgi:beta-1,4-N-acetylglucosaminyltransferase
VVILVTVGTHTEGFNRLVEAMDRIAAQVEEEVVMQIGATAYVPQAALWFDFTTQAQMDALCEGARVIVSHAGAGSILKALGHRKPTIIVPRRQNRGEHIDDHQLELAEALSRTGALTVAYDVDELVKLLEAAPDFVPPEPNRGHLIEAVRQAIQADGWRER